MTHVFDVWANNTELKRLFSDLVLPAGIQYLEGCVLSPSIFTENHTQAQAYRVNQSNKQLARG